jgi:hypothetical protein
MRCTQFRPLVDEDHGAGLSPDCRWRERLTELLRAWWRESPEEASLVACGQDFGEATRTVPPLRPDASGRAHEVAVEADWGAGAPEPITRALLDSVHITPDGGAYLGDHANWVLRLKGLDAREHPRLFVQLAVLASNLAEREDRLPLARAVAHLARIGLVPLARETRRV